MMRYVLKWSIYQTEPPDYSPDVLARQNDCFLLVESKMTVPPMGIRIFDQNAYNRHLEIRAEAVYQLYKQVVKFLHAEYYPFSKIHPVRCENTWGVVSVLEDSFISRKAIYEKAAELLSIQINSKEYTWLTNHIKLLSLYDIEKVSFVGQSIITEIQRKECTGNPFDFSIEELTEETLVNAKFISFKEKINDVVEKTMTDMINHGVIHD